MTREFKPTVDSSLGLVFRLNDLWTQVDRASIEGGYDTWNNVLEALWRNLCYRNPMEVTGDGKVELSNKDKKGWEILCRNVNVAKKNWIISQKKFPNKVRYYWGQRYLHLQLKDVFLRKKMFELKLYLKETEKNISGATFGGFGKSK